VPLVACTSEAVTHGVRVQVRSEYMREHSDSSQGAHAFAYYVTLVNEGLAPVQARNAAHVAQRCVDARACTGSVTA
jgi:uncharacterized protein affecting Mg2+/Co2+ transport